MQFPLISRLAKNVNVFRTRAEYLEKTGKVAPEFDWSRPIKNWEDTRKFPDADEEVEYFGVRYDANGKPFYDAATGVCETKRFKLYPEVATTVNMIPSPFPALGSLTTAQQAMAKRIIPEPLELLEGERIVLGRSIGSDPVVDDGKIAPGGATGGGFTEADRNMLKDIVTLLRSFQNPAQK